MFEFQKTHRIHALCGLDRSGEVRVVPDIWCVRKHMDRQHSEWKQFKEIDPKNLFAFVSSPKMSGQQSGVMSGINMWCHPFRKRHKHLTNENAQYIMLPESDFLDAKLIPLQSAKTEYDFFYFTLNSKEGITYKGLDVFINCLPMLCGKLHLRGVVLVYFPAAGTSRRLKVLNNDQKRILSQYSDKLTFIWGWQNKNRLSEIMRSARFGFFPNMVDCSPRIIPECLLRNRPVVVNSKIWGGWHYITSDSGCFFDPVDVSALEGAVDFVLGNKFETRLWFSEHFGFAKSSARLAEFLSAHHLQLQGFTNVYFKCYEKVMRDLL